MRTLALLPLALLLTACAEDGPSAVAERLFKARRVMFEQPELVGINRDGEGLVIVYRDQAKPGSDWITYHCYPPVVDRRWFCDRIGSPKNSVFLP